MRARYSLRKTVYWLSVLAILLQAGLPVARAYGATATEADSSRFLLGFSEICSALSTASALPGSTPATDAPVTKNGHCVLCHLPAFGGSALDARILLPEPVDIGTVVYLPVETVAVQSSAAAAPKPIRAPPA